MLAKKPKGATEKKQGSGLASLLWMFVGAILTLMVGLFLYLWNPFDMGGQTTVPPANTVQPINQQNNDDGDYEFYDLLPEQEVTNIPDEAIVRQEPVEEVELDPDVIVEAPEPQETDNSNSTNSHTQEYGISEDTIQNPMQSQAPQAVEGDSEIAIIEEEGTYDEPIDNTASNDNQATSNSSNTTHQPITDQSTVSIEAVKPTTYILQINSFGSAEEADKRRAQVLMAGVDAKVIKNQHNEQVLYQVVSAPMTNRQAVIAAQQKLQNNGIDSLIVEQRR